MTRFPPGRYGHVTYAMWGLFVKFAVWATRPRR